MRFYLLCCVCLLSLTPGFAQQILTIPAASSENNASGARAIDSLFRSYIDNKFIGGATAIVARNGKIIYYNGLGYHDLQSRKPIEKTDIFRIASQTKAVTSVAIMMLYDEGKLQLTDPVSKFLPEYKNQQVLAKFNASDTTYTTVPAKRDITILDLMTHSSGIGYAQIGSSESNAIYAKSGIPGGIGVYNISLAEKMRLLGKLPLLHQPGERWTYGLNMDLMGYLVEVISGMDLDRFFRERIFNPLGMKDTYFYLPVEKYGRLVSLNTEDSTGHVLKAPASMNLNGVVMADYPASAGTYFSGGAGLSSTAFDYAIFLQMLLNKGEYNGKRLLKPATVDLMTTDQFAGLDWPDMRVGLGFALYTSKTSARSPVSPGSYEWGGMFSSTYWVDPKEKIVAQVFVNQYPHTHEEIHEKFKELVYKSLIR